MYGMLNFDYFIAGSWDHQFLLECVLRTLQVFTLYNFKVQVFVCDGASANLALIKLLCGYKWEQLPLCDGEDPFAVTASFQNPCEDKGQESICCCLPISPGYLKLKKLHESIISIAYLKRPQISLIH